MFFIVLILEAVRLGNRIETFKFNQLDVCQAENFRTSPRIICARFMGNYEKL